MHIPNLPPLQCLVAFEAAMRHGSITRAASALNLTPSAVSRQITQLEQFLGRKLFLREKRALQLTTVGQQYGAQIHSLLIECSQATTEIMKARGRLDLTIACASGTATFWLAPRIGDFMQRHPEIKIRILSRDAITALSTAEFDIGIYYLRDSYKEGLTVERILDEQVFALCAPHYLEGKILPPEQLTDKMLLMCDESLWMNWPAWLSLCGVKVGAGTLKHTFTSNHYTILLQMALLGNGVLLGWKHITDPLVASRALVKASEASASFGGGYHLVWPNGRMETSAMRVFKEWIMKQVKKSSPYAARLS